MRLKLYNPLSRLIITQGFGVENTHSSMLPAYQKMGLLGHNGYDLVAYDSTPVYASHDGRVTFAGYDGSGGLGVVIRTNDEVEYNGGTAFIKSIYWHLKTGSLKVTGSQQVKRGDLIGLADNTGFSTGSHLHWGIKPMKRGENDWEFFNTEDTNGYSGAIDPTPYIVPFQYDLSTGMTHEDVIKLQRELQKLNFFTAVPFDKYGEQTRKAVLLFQKKYVALSWYEEYILRGTKFGLKSRTALNTLLGF